jgi:hypothetical protein
MFGQTSALLSLTCGVQGAQVGGCYFQVPLPCGCLETDILVNWGKEKARAVSSLITSTVRFDKGTGRSVAQICFTATVNTEVCLRSDDYGGGATSAGEKLKENANRRSGVYDGGDMLLGTKLTSPAIKPTGRGLSGLGTWCRACSFLGDDDTFLGRSAAGKL